jgi:hypothetical protein
MTVVYPFHTFMHKPCNTANILTLNQISQTRHGHNVLQVVVEQSKRINTVQLALLLSLGIGMSSTLCWLSIYMLQRVAVHRHSLFSLFTVRSCYQTLIQ